LAVHRLVFCQIFYLFDAAPGVPAVAYPLGAGTLIVLLVEAEKGFVRYLKR